MNTLESFRNNRLRAGQTHTFGRPVARRALTIVGPGDHDQRLLAFHVGFDGFPHARDLAFGFDPSQRTGLYLAVFQHHLVLQGGIGESGALRGQVIAAVSGVRVEVFLWQAHFRQILA